MGANRVARPLRRGARRLGGTVGLGSRQAVRDRVVDLGLRSTVAGRLLGVPPRAIAVNWFDDVPNVGDAVSPVVVAHATGRPAVRVGEEYSGKLLAVGSIVRHARAGDVVWGSGSIRDAVIRPPDGVRYLAVRGPLTRAAIAAEVPEVYGDPAVLLPLVHTPREQPRVEVGVVPHYVDRPAVVAAVGRDPGVRVIDVRRPWRTVVDAVASCDVIVSTSLHGLVLAEAFGVPAAWMAVAGTSMAGGWFKFHDYLLGTGRSDEHRPTMLSDGLAAAVGRPLPPSRELGGARLLAALEGLDPTACRGRRRRAQR